MVYYILGFFMTFFRQWIRKYFHEKREENGKHLTRWLSLFPSSHIFSNVFYHFPTFFHQMDPKNFQRKRSAIKHTLIVAMSFVCCSKLNVYCCPAEPCGNRLWWFLIPAPTSEPFWWELVELACKFGDVPICAKPELWPNWLNCGPEFLFSCSCGVLDCRETELLILESWDLTIFILFRSFSLGKWTISCLAICKNLIIFSNTTLVFWLFVANCPSDCCTRKFVKSNEIIWILFGMKDK